jgi:hypothetical protein
MQMNLKFCNTLGKQKGTHATVIVEVVAAPNHLVEAKVNIPKGKPVEVSDKFCVGGKST